VRTLKGTVILFFLAWTTLPAPIAPQDPPPRLVRVKLAADRGIEDRTEWRIAAVRLLDDCFRSFREGFAIKLRIDDFATWSPEPGRRALAARLAEMRRKVPPGACDLVLGVMAPGRTGAAPLGIASYPFACVLVKNLPAREDMVYAVLHELCHVFGAADLNERGSVMGIKAPGFGIDAFTAEAIRLNKDRSFDRKSFPLDEAASRAAVSAFAARARKGLGEPQVQLFLTQLEIEKGDLASAAEACAAAEAADPALPGLHNLMGNICLFRGDYDLALAEYRKALESQPYEPGVYFNIGLAFVEKGLLGDAAAAYREALKADPRYAEARQALESVLRAGNDVEAARNAVKTYLTTVRKQAGA
jgi:tetratricopeptide (TPR) repeat protein